MKTIRKTLSFAGAGVLFLLGASVAQAAVITYDFWGEVQDGPLTAETYTGSFSFDDASLTNSGDLFLPVDTLSFNFHGSAFTGGSGDVAPEVVYSNGTFVGLSYTVTSFDPEFSIVPGLFDASDGYFAYTTSSGAGFGSVQYGIAAVPVPGALWLLASAMSWLGAVNSRKRSIVR